MSALQLTPTKKGAYVDCCSTEGCNRQGRFRVSILGHIAPSSGTALEHQEMLCHIHGKEQQAIWDEFSGKTAFTLLQGSKADRADGIDLLRSIGWKAEAAVEAGRAA